MKVVSIISSGRQKGNTERIVKLIENDLLQAAEKQNIPLEIEHISLCRHNIQFCMGCRACFDKDEKFLSNQRRRFKSQ